MAVIRDGSSAGDLNESTETATNRNLVQKDYMTCPRSESECQRTGKETVYRND